DEDSKRGCPFDRDVVDADAVAGDDEASGRRLERLRRQLPPVRQDRVDAACKLDELGLGTGGRLEQLRPGEHRPLDLERRPGVVGDEDATPHPRNYAGTCSSSPAREARMYARQWTSAPLRTSSASWNGRDERSSVCSRRMSFAIGSM